MTGFHYVLCYAALWPLDGNLFEATSFTTFLHLISPFFLHFPAAKAVNTCYIASTYSTCSVEEIVAAAPNGFRWFQLYLYQDRKLSEQIVHKVEALGYKALVLTVDVPYTGKRRNDIRNQFKLPPHLKVKNFEGMFQVGQ